MHLNISNKFNIKSADIIILNPFLIFEFHNIFDIDTLQKLKVGFPDKSLFPGRYLNKGGKFHFHSTTKEFAVFVNDSPVWRELYQYFSKPSVVAAFYALTQLVPSERNILERNPWQLCSRLEQKGFFQKWVSRFGSLKAKLLGRTQVYLTFEFSYMEQGCHIPPHTDLPEKLISLMIYFPEDNIHYPLGTGTEFYSTKIDDVDQASWDSSWKKDNELKEFFEQHDIFYTSPFTENKLVGFVKSSNSWHGVRQLNLPENVTRRSLNINYYLAV